MLGGHRLVRRFHRGGTAEMQTRPNQRQVDMCCENPKSGYPD